MLDSKEVDKLIERAVTYADAGEHDRAVPLLQTLIENGFEAFNLNLGLSLLELQESAAARKAFERGSLLGFADCKYELALMMEDAGEIKQARQLLTSLAGAGDRDAAFALGMSWYKAHDDEQAADVLTPLLNGEDEAASASAGVLGLLLLERGEAESAEPLLRRGASTFPPAREALDELDAGRGGA